MKRGPLLGILLAACVLFVWWLRHEPTWEIKNDPPSGTNIIALGDSLTKLPPGIGEKTYPEILSDMIGKPIINAGVSGNTTAQVMARLERDVLDRDPKIVLVLIGGNDFLKERRPIDDIIGSIREIILQIQDKGAMVVLVGLEVPTPLGGVGGSKFRDLAQETGAVYVPTVMKGILDNPGLRLDPIHPNTSGAKIMAERIEERAGEYLRR